MPSETDSASIAPARANVAGLSLEDKLMRAAQLTTAKLPAHLRAEFGALFRPENLAVTAGVLGAWGASHLAGIGFIADVVMLLVGLLTVGWMAFQIAEDIQRFVAIASRAQSDADLDRAATHLARAVSTLGAQLFVALITKKAGGRVVTDARVRRLHAVLIRLGMPTKPPMVQARVGVALDFFEKRLPTMPEQGVLSRLKAIDFSKEVRRVHLEPGEVLIAYPEPAAAGGHQAGLYYTRSGVSFDRLGISKGSAADARGFKRYRVTKRVEVLESTAAPAADTWTRSRVAARRDGAELVGGGGVQYIVPDHATALVPVD